jgi:hypothetical protein
MVWGRQFKPHRTFGLIDPDQTFTSPSNRDQLRFGYERFSTPNGGHHVVHGSVSKTVEAKYTSPNLALVVRKFKAGLSITVFCDLSYCMRWTQDELIPRMSVAVRSTVHSFPTGLMGCSLVFPKNPIRYGATWFTEN